MEGIIFFPVGNADTCLLATDDERLLLFDFAAPKNQGDDDKRIDLAEELRNRLAEAGRDDFDVVSFSHLDTDHFSRGLPSSFTLEHAKKYQGEGRVHIKEMWVPAAAIVESRWEQSEEGRIVQAEARHRLKEGKGIRVISEPKGSRQVALGCRRKPGRAVPSDSECRELYAGLHIGKRRRRDLCPLSVFVPK